MMAMISELNSIFHKYFPISVLNNMHLVLMDEFNIFYMMNTCLYFHHMTHSILQSFFAMVIN